MKHKIVKELDKYGAVAPGGGNACLVKIGEDHFIVSTIHSAFDHHGAETLAFPCDEHGEVTSWTDVAGGQGKSREQTIAELVHEGPNTDLMGRGIFADPKNPSSGELVRSTLSTFGELARRVEEGDEW